MNISYLDIFVGPYSIETVLAELARYLSLFSNLHTVQIDVDENPCAGRRYFGDIFEQTFKTFISSDLQCFRHVSPWIPSLHLAHRHGASALHDIRQCPLTDRVCTLYLVIVLVWKYLKASMKFIRHLVCVSIYLLLSLHCKVLTITHFSSRCQ